MSTKKLTDQQQRRKTVELAIRKNITAALEGFCVLYGEKLWEGEFTTFVAYLVAVWGYSPSYASRFSECVEFVSSLPNGNPLRAALTEGAFRPLHILSDKQKLEAARRLEHMAQEGISLTDTVTEVVAQEIVDATATETPASQETAGPNMERFKFCAAELLRKLELNSTALKDAQLNGDVKKGTAAIFGVLSSCDEALKDVFREKSKRTAWQRAASLAGDKEDLSRKDHEKASRQLQTA
jgi:hypothetical protein